MTYQVMQEADTETVARLYLEYYNVSEGGCWTYEKAYKRIHQMVTIEDSLCLLQKDGENRITGFEIGYFKEYDDLRCFYLEEIVILAEYQNKGLGTEFLHELERRALENHAEHIELTSVNDAHHMHFYGGFGMYAATNLKIMGKHYGE